MNTFNQIMKIVRTAREISAERVGQFVSLFIFNPTEDNAEIPAVVDPPKDDDTARLHEDSSI